MGNDLGSGPEKVAQISKSWAQHWGKNSLDACLPLLWERLELPGHMLVHIKGASRGLMH